MTRHVDAYPRDANGHISRTRRWRWDIPGLPYRSQVTQSAYWEGETFFTAPHEDGHCDEYAPSPTQIETLT